MTIYEPNDEVRPTGEEPAEFIPPDEPHEDVSDEDDDAAEPDSSTASAGSSTPEA